MIIIQNVSYSKNSVLISETFLISVILTEQIATWNDVKAKNWGDLKNKTWQEVQLKDF